MLASSFRRALPLVLFVLGCTTPKTPPPVAPPQAAQRWQTQLDADHPLVGVLFDVAARRRITEADLADRVRAADMVLVGETHDNPDHHRLQASLLLVFASTHRAPAVVFEMLDRAEQPAVDASLAAHPGDPDALADAVSWQSSGWPSWSMYRPVFEAALATGGPILAAGLDRSTAMRVARAPGAVGALDPALVRTFGLDTPLPPAEQTSLQKEMSEAHCGLLPESMLDAMVLVQRARDALLAERLHEGVERAHGALLIAGAGHVRRDRGVPAQLTRAYGARSLAVGLVQVSAGDTTPERYAAEFDAGALPFDVVWFTPRANDVDRCAEMRSHVKQP